MRFLAQVFTMTALTLRTATRLRIVDALRKV